MTRREPSLSSFWQEWAPYGMAALFVVVFFALIWRQYVTFNIRASDLDRFSQAIWNTLHGRFLYSTIENRSILGGHFSPFMALLSPLLIVWEDARILSLAQTIGLAAAGLFLHKLVREKHPTLAPWFLLAFYLNPALHEIALLELRRITFAVPFLALAFYALSVKNRGLMALGLFIALLCKENVAIVVVMVGGHLLLFERDWKWGISLILFGVVWVAMVLFLINPILDPKVADATVQANAYRGLRYFAQWGDSPPQMLINMLRKPIKVVRWMFDPSGLRALWRVFLPLGLVLPVLTPSWFLLTIPSMSYMLLSGYRPMHRLEDWYMASILPTLFAATGIGLTRRPLKQARLLTAVLLGSTILGFILFSYAPFGGKFRPQRYELTDHHQLAAEVLSSVPKDASVAAMVAFTSHLALREQIYLYPWVNIEEKEVEYLVLDRQLNAYPMNDQERDDAINNLVANPDYVIEVEADGMYLIRNGGEQLPARNMGRVAEDAIRLDRVEIALADNRGFFHTVTDEALDVEAGQDIRVTLYWEAVGTPTADRTVSVRVTDAQGVLIAQHDMMPSNGARPTSWWQPGWKFRDVYYVTIPPETGPEPATLNVLLYDSYNGELVSFDGEEILELAQLTIVSP